MPIEQPLVSLICPCYNSEKFIYRFLDSILGQTYTNIQLIIVDDGSTDKTVELIKEYKERFEQKFSQFLLLEQENGGAASAVNNALKYVKGKYLSWADSDDVLSPNNIFKKMEFLENNLNMGLVICQARAVDEKSGNLIRTLFIDKENQSKNIFKNLIFPGVPCYPGVFMIRTKLLFERLIDKSISYNREVGQNWQLLLPVAYDHECGYIEECLYDYYIRLDSHSHNTDYKREIRRTYEQEKILQQVLFFIEDEKKQKLFYEITQNYMFRRLNIAFSNLDTKLFEYHYKEALLFNNSIQKKYVIKRMILKNSILKLLYKCYKVIKHRVS